MSFLVRYADGAWRDDVIEDEAAALCRVVEPYEKGIAATLWQQLPVKLTAKARIVRRKTSAPEAAAGAIPPSRTAAPPDADSVCDALKCDEPRSTASGFCRAHGDALAGGVKFPRRARTALQAKGAGPLVPHG